MLLQAIVDITMSIISETNQKIPTHSKKSNLIKKRRWNHLSNLDDYTDEDEDDSDEDDSSENEEPPMDPNSEEYKQLVSKLSTIALPPISN